MADDRSEAPPSGSDPDRVEPVPAAPSTSVDPAAHDTERTARTHDSGEVPPDDPVARSAAADAAPLTWRERRRARRERRRNRKAPWWEFPLLIVAALAVAILVKSFVAQPFYIPSQSMEKTLHGCPGCNDDKILVSKLVYDVRDPHPGDIVVFKAPPGWDDGPRPTVPSNPIAKGVRKLAQLVGVVPPDDYVLVKRVIAVGGQTVKGDAAGNVYISDHGSAGPWRKLTEPYVFRDGGAVEQAATFGPVTVPKGRLWVMGDHRNASADSRFHCSPTDGTVGGPSCDPTSSTVPNSDVIGKAVWTIWPVSRWRTLGTPSTFGAAGAAGAPLAGIALVAPVALLRRRRRRR